MSGEDLQATAAGAALAVTSPADHVAVVTIDRPEKANTIDDDMHYALTGIWQRIERRGDVRAIVLTGRGRVFCGGGDRDQWPSLIEDRQYRRNKMNEARAIVVNMLRCELPVVAAVNGPAVGLGCTLALAADLVVMADDAHLVDPHVAHGIVAGDGGAALLPYLIPPAQARGILFTGRPVPADEALRLGLATEVVPAEALADRAVGLAAQLAACSVDAIRDTKRAINLGLLQQALPVLELSSAAEASSFDTEHYRRAVGWTATGDGGAGG
ncbi:MAG TPA: enoyl-CoA hydratase/isomerase family protein [Acidimicrobiales bacterium]|nr:enoyl-CoA hydratase/isomerase family protein [Acidimicrobiales bacterium]